MNIQLRIWLDTSVVTLIVPLFLQCFDAVGWVAGRASGLYKTEWWGAGVVICLERGADLHTAQLMPLHSLSLASVKSRLVVPFCVCVLFRCLVPR